MATSIRKLMHAHNKRAHLWENARRMHSSLRAMGYTLGTETCQSAIIAVMPGYISHELQYCLENCDRYILLVRWQQLEDHTVGFRQSPEYQEWRSLLHHFYDPFPTVEHYQMVLENEG